MKILAIYRHFWPDSPPYALMLRRICAHLAEQGHDVGMLAEQPNYKSGDLKLNPARKETLDGIDVKRLRRLPFMAKLPILKKVGAVLFPARLVADALWRRLRGEKRDVIWTATIPPVVNGFCGGIAAKILGARFIYHFQDVYPELAGYAGNWKKGGVVYRACAAVERINCRMAAACIVLSEDMADTVAARGVPREKIHIINNFMLDSFEQGSATCPPELAPREGVMRVIFAGNIGRFQGLEAAIEAARLLEADMPDVEFMFLGEGPNLANIKKLSEGLSNVRFAPHMPFHEASAVIETADLGLVSIQPDIYRVAYPSKTLTYLGLGVPVLAVVEPESALARSLMDEEIGFVSQGRDGAALADAVRAAYAVRETLPAMRTRAKAHYDGSLSAESALARWNDLIVSLKN